MMTSITNEQRRDVLVRLGWNPAAVRRFGPEELAQALNHAWVERPLRVEFEALRQLGHAFEQSEVADLPNR